jgi:hypothetical protein
VADRPESSDPRSAGSAVGDAIVELIARVPATRETALADPDAHVRRLARQAARRAR